MEVHRLEFWNFEGNIDENLRVGLKSLPVAVKVLNKKGLQGYREWLESMDVDLRRALFSQKPKSPTDKGRPSNMVFKKAHMVIPAHIVAEAISTLHGLDLRWSGTITPTEINYVEQYILAKYPEYSNALVEGGEKT
ncbi:hypothetical protein AgCh_029829 [Apium graveolens]